MIKAIKKRIKYRRQQKRNEAKELLKDDIVYSKYVPIYGNTINNNIEMHSYSVRLKLPPFKELGLKTPIKVIWQCDIFLNKIPVIKTFVFGFLLLFGIIIFLLIKVI